VSSFRSASVLALLAAGLFLQLHFVGSYPQPALFGDPGAYHFVGLELRDAAGRWADGEELDSVVESVAPYLYLAGIGSVYGVTESLRGACRRTADALSDGGAQSFYWLRPLPFFRLVLALVNVLGMLGAFVLAWQLSGSFNGGLIALAAAAVYPSFALQIGRLFPEPVFTTLFVWASVCYYRAIKTSSVRFMVASGFLLGSGFFFRAQLMNYFPILLGAWLVLSMPFWLRESRARKLVLALVLSTLPFVVAWKVLTSTASEDFSKIEEFGFFHFPEQHLYPYGFWMLLDADGWMGAYQLREDPFFLEMVEAAKQDEDLLRSRPRQLAFTASYVASRFGESVLVVLDNIYRTHARPANNYQWDYPFSTEVQTWFQKVLVVLALAFVGLVAWESPALTGVFFVPLCLALLFGMSTPQPRYGQPSMLIVIAAAAAFVSRLEVRAFMSRKRWYVASAIAIVGFVALGSVLRPYAPDLARVARALSVLAIVAVPFVVGWHQNGAKVKQGVVLAVSWSCLALVVTAHQIRDRQWHEVAIDLGGSSRSVEQEILLPAAALSSLRAASEAFLLLDVHAPAGNLDLAAVVINGKRFEGSMLVPTMVDMGESTVTGGRNPHRYRQWWALPLPRHAPVLPERAPAVVNIKLEVAPTSPSFTIYGDRFRDQERRYEGPSFGDTPHTSAPKLEYDGDYRLPVNVPLESAGSSSFLIEGSDRTPLASVLRMRLVTLTSNEGSYAWDSPSVTPGEAAALSFRAFSHGEGEAELLVGGAPVLRFPLGSSSDFDVAGSSYALCYRADAPRGDNEYGSYLLRLPEDSVQGGPVRLGVRFRSGMSRTRRFFTVDPGAGGEPPHCDIDDTVAVVPGLGRVVDASRNSYPRDTGRWSVDKVY